MENTNQSQFTRDDFMNFFRDDECLNQLSPDDRIEVFSQILLGSFDFTKELLDDILSDYSVDTLEIVEVVPKYEPYSWKPIDYNQQMSFYDWVRQFK